MQEYTVKIVFNDGDTLLIECDKFTTNDAGYFKAMRGGQLINVIPFQNVKYTKLNINNRWDELPQPISTN